MTAGASLAQPDTGRDLSSRHILAGEEYCETLSADFGIAYTDVVDALLNEPMKRALRIAEWAEKVERTPMERGRALRAWARKMRSGIYREEETGPEPAPVVHKIVYKKREKLSPQQILKNLERMEAGVL